MYRSFIFSSEYIRRYARLSRAEKGWHARIAVVLTVVALVASQLPRGVYRFVRL